MLVVHAHSSVGCPGRLGIADCNWTAGARGVPDAVTVLLTSERYGEMGARARPGFLTLYSTHDIDVIFLRRVEQK